MIGRISQLKQTISDEFQQASAPPKTNDPIAVIERNSKLLTTEAPNVDNIISELGEPGESKEESEEPQPNSTESNKEQPAAAETPKEGAKDESPPSESAKPEPKSSEESGSVNASRTVSEEPVSAPASAPAPASASASAPTPASTPATTAPAPTDPALQAKLSKLAKYEDKYPQLLKAYKLEKKKGELVKLYEKVLSEYTPCSSIAEPQMLVDYLSELTKKANLQQQELKDVHADLASSRKQVDELKQNVSSIKSELATTKTALSKLETELSQARSENEKNLKQAQNAAEESAREADLRAKIEMLESQLDAAEQARQSAAKSQSSMKSQFDELNSRLGEKLAEIDVLRDELRESERLARDRLHELSTLKGQIHHQERGKRKSADETDSQLAKITAEKEQLEADVELLNKRVIREADQLNLQIKSLRTQLQESEAHENQLRQQLAASNGPRSQDLSKSTSGDNLAGSTATATTTGASGAIAGVSPEALEKLSRELAESKEAAFSMSKANELLKQVNSDNALRIEKLQKAQRALILDIEQLRHENLVLRKQSRRGSIASVKSNSTSSAAIAATESEQAEGEKQQAYLKNVLLGFIEHKDQRKALMPVLGTLLGMKESESERFLREFS